MNGAIPHETSPPFLRACLVRLGLFLKTSCWRLLVFEGRVGAAVSRSTLAPLPFRFPFASTKKKGACPSSPRKRVPVSRSTIQPLSFHGARGGKFSARTSATRSNQTSGFAPACLPGWRFFGSPRFLKAPAEHWRALSSAKPVGRSLGPPPMRTGPSAANKGLSFWTNAPEALPGPHRCLLAGLVRGRAPLAGWWQRPPSEATPPLCAGARVSTEVIRVCRARKNRRETGSTAESRRPPGGSRRRTARRASDVDDEGLTAAGLFDRPRGTWQPAGRTAPGGGPGRPISRPEPQELAALPLRGHQPRGPWAGHEGRRATPLVQTTSPPPLAGPRPLAWGATRIITAPGGTRHAFLTRRVAPAAGPLPAWPLGRAGAPAERTECAPGWWRRKLVPLRPNTVEAGVSHA